MKKLLIKLILVFSLFVIPSFSHAFSENVTEANIPIKIKFPENYNELVQIEVKSIRNDFSYNTKLIIDNTTKYIPVKFTKVGEYEFIINQNSILYNKDLKYDKSNYKVIVFVENEKNQSGYLKGNLVNSIVIQKDENIEKSKEVKFENTLYNPNKNKDTESESEFVNDDSNGNITKDDKGIDNSNNELNSDEKNNFWENPGTGDNSNNLLNSIIFISSIVLFIIILRKRKKEEYKE